MKMNWGNGILIAFILFCSFIIAIVWKSFQYDVNLVSEQYYQEELEYQQRIDAIKNTKELDKEVVIEQVGEKLSIKLPNNYLKEGNIHFYRPEDAKMDRTVPITALESEITLALLTSGRYTAKLSWSDSNKTYFAEKDIYIP